MAGKPLRILAAVDGAGGSESILSALADLARLTPVEVSLLRVSPKPEDVGEAQGDLARLAADLESRRLRVVTLVEPGDPASAILGRLRSGAFDYGALTTHARRGLSRLLAGSVAESVIRSSEIPLIVHRPDGQAGNWKEIVVALDGSREAEAILDEVTRLAIRVASKVHLVHVVEIPSTVPVPEESYSAVVLPDMKTYLEGLRSRLAARGLNVTAQSLMGPAAPEIVRYAAETGGGLIALTTLGRSGFRRVIMGSVAEQILRTAPCPILVQRTVKDVRPAESPPRAEVGEWEGLGPTLGLA